MEWLKISTFIGPVRWIETEKKYNDYKVRHWLKVWRLLQGMDHFKHAKNDLIKSLIAQ